MTGSCSAVCTFTEASFSVQKSSSVIHNLLLSLTYVQEFTVKCLDLNQNKVMNLCHFYQRIFLRFNRQSMVICQVFLYFPVKYNVVRENKQTNKHTHTKCLDWLRTTGHFILFIFQFRFFFFFNHHPRIHFYSFWRERQKGGGRGEAVCGGGERGRQRERQDNQLLPASSVCLMGGGTCNPGVCPDQIPKLQPFGVQEDAPTNWAS